MSLTKTSRIHARRPAGCIYLACRCGMGDPEAEQQKPGNSKAKQEPRTASNSEAKMRARTGHFSPLLQTNPQSHLPNPLLWHRTCISTPMSPEIALTELRGGLVTVLWIAGPMLLAVLVVGVVIGVVQAATQLNEPTIGFVAKAVALTATLFATGSMLLGHLVEFTIELFHRIPHLIG